MTNNDRFADSPLTSLAPLAFYPVDAAGEFRTAWAKVRYGAPAEVTLKIEK